VASYPGREYLPRAVFAEATDALFLRAFIHPLTPDHDDIRLNWRWAVPMGRVICSPGRCRPRPWPGCWRATRRPLAWASRSRPPAPAPAPAG